MLRREELAAVVARQIEVSVRKLNRGVALNRAREHRGGELLHRAVVRGQERLRLREQLPGIQLRVVDHLAGDRERILPDLMLDQLLVADLIAVDRQLAVLTDDARAFHRGHAGELLRPVRGLRLLEQFRADRLLLKSLGALLKERANGSLRFTVNGLIQTGRFGKNKIRHCVCSSFPWIIRILQEPSSRSRYRRTRRQLRCQSRSWP